MTSPLLFIAHSHDTADHYYHRHHLQPHYYHDHQQHQPKQSSSLFPLPEHDDDLRSLLIRSAYEQACSKFTLPPRPRRRVPSLQLASVPSSPLRPRARQLTAPSSLMTCIAVETTVTSPDTAPGSPPDLTTSKSSKSSSYQSSGLSDVVGSHDIAHFEDISLDDLHFTSPSSLAGPDFAGRLDSHGSAKRRSSPANGVRPSAHAASSFRDLTNNPKKRNQILQLGTPGAPRSQKSLALPKARAPRRGFTSPSTTSLPFAPGHRSRSPSPSLPHGFPVSNSLSLSRRSTPNLLASPNSVSFGQVRYGQGRAKKSVEELEAEYDDLDNELPDDADIYNVPISPRPAPERSNPVSPIATSPSKSFPGSSDFSLSHPSSRSNSAPLEKEATPNSPQDPYKLRSRSYDDVFTKLDPEIQTLTAELEKLQDKRDRLREEEVQKGRAPERKSEDFKIAASMIELPPVQKRNIMIDPLPPSREKEKVLTRTRPSWLPPKDPKEDRRHTKEYIKMQAAFLEAEKKRVAKEQQKQQERDSVLETTSKLWDTILPNWSELVKNNPARIRELFWTGVAPRHRPAVWMKALGNELELKEASYAAALNRANVKYNELMCLTPDDRANRKEHIWFEAIERDTQDTFPELNMFQPGCPLHGQLVNVLKAYAMYRSDVGYVYGTNLMAGLLLLNFDESRAFALLANILNRPVPMGFLLRDTTTMTRTYSTVLTHMAAKLPRLHHHLTSVLALEPADFLDPMFRTCLCWKLGSNHASRVWDVYMFDGDAALVRAALAVLASLEGRLYVSKREALELLGWEDKRKWDLGDDVEFMETMRDIGKRPGEDASIS